MNFQDAITHLQAVDGLAEALASCQHPIAASIREKFQRYGAMSPAQAKLVLRLAEQQTRPEAPKARAPIGRHVVCGTVVAKKSYEGEYGLTYKMLVRIDTPEGEWKCWGTVPRSLLCGGEAEPQRGAAPGAVVEFTATLEPGKDPGDQSFVVFKRPVKARIVAPAMRAEEERQWA